LRVAMPDYATVSGKGKVVAARDGASRP